MFTTQFKIFVAAVAALVIMVGVYAYASHLQHRVTNLEDAVLTIHARLNPVAVTPEPTATPSATVAPVPVKRFVPVAPVPTK